MTAAVFRNDIRISGVKPFDSTYVTITGVTVVFLIMLCGILFYQKPRSFTRIALLAAIVGLAAFCQLEDHPGYRLFHPDSLVQAHAVWHLLMALAAALAYDLFAAIEGRPSLWRRAA